MSRSSPGVWRIAAILNFIADHPGQAFALTDLVRALKLSRATCHALLTGLVEVGYLFRTSDKAYVLGPKLAAIGRIAEEHYSPLQIAKPEMRSIADAYDVVCGAYFLEGDIMHLRERAASASHVAYPVPLGTRMKLRSAQAVIYHAWSPKDTEAWLARTRPAPSPEKVTLMRDSMAFAREHGFVILVRNTGVMFGFSNSEPVYPDDETDDLPVITVASVEDDALYPIAAIMAPVFDAKGKVTFALVMAGFHSAMTGLQALEAGERLRAACARISGFVSGGSPSGAAFASR